MCSLAWCVGACASIPRDSNDVSASRLVQPAGPGEQTYTAYTPPELRSETNTLGLIRRRARRVGNTIKQKVEQLLHRSGQPVTNPRPGPPRSDRSFVIPQPHGEAQQEAQDALLARIFEKTELTVDSHPRPLGSHPPRPESVQPLQTQIWPYPAPSDPTSLYPESPEDITQEAPFAQGTYEAPAELPSEPRAQYAAEFAEAEVRYHTIFNLPESPPRHQHTEHPLSAAKQRSRHSSRVVPAVADRRPPYPVTPPASPRGHTPASLPERVRDLGMPAEGKLQHPPKRTITMDASTFTMAGQVSHELHFEDNEPFNKVSVPSRAVVAELEGTASFEDEKTMKRRPRSMPDLHFDFGFPTGETNTGFTRSGSPVVLKAGPSPTRKSFIVGACDETSLEAQNPAPWKTYKTSNSTDSVYKAYVQEKVYEDLSEEVSTSTKTLEAQKVKNRNHTAYIRKEEDRLSEEASMSEEALKAQKLKNRISSGFMPDQTPLTEVIKAATEANLMFTDFADTMQDAESPVSPLEPVATAWARATVMAPVSQVSKTVDETKIAPTTFGEILGTPGHEADELHRQSSASLTRADSTSSVTVKLIEPTPVSYQTLRRVRAAKVEMRSLARPLHPGESTSSGSLLDTPIPTTLTTTRSSRLLTPTAHKDDDESSWNWPRFVDQSYEDPAAEVSRRFRQKKAWAKTNTGPLVVFEGRGYAMESEAQGEVTDKEDSSKRWSWREMAKGKNVEELLNLFEGR